MSFAYVEGSPTPNLAGLVDVGTLDGTGDTGIRLSGGGGGTFELLAAPGLLWGTAAVRNGMADLSNDHGAYAGLPLYRAREFSLVGEITVPTVDDLWGAIDLLYRTFNLGDRSLKTLTLNTAGWAATRQIAARVDGEIELVAPSDKNGHLATRRGFTVPMLAPDPRIYSTTEHATTVASGGTVVSNAGNMPTPIRVRFNGAQTGPVSVTDSVDSLVSSASPTSGHWVEVNTRDPDAATATAYDDAGASKFSTVSDWSLATLPAGDTTLTSDNAGGAGTTVVYHRDAWS